MASTTSTSRDGGATVKIRSAASSLSNDAQSLIVEIRKAVNRMKEIAVCMEKDNDSAVVFQSFYSEMFACGRVKDLENAVAELLESYEDSAHHASAIEFVGNTYQPGEQLTDFKKLLEAEFQKLKSSSSSAPQNHPLMRQFREAIWNVHHSGQPMPGEEQEDIIMTSTQSNLLNITCPLSGKPVSELAQPVRSVLCKHIYEKKAIMHYIAAEKAQAICPIAGCPKILRADKVVCDPLLPIEIEEMRSMSRQTARTNVVEDFTELDDEVN